MHNCDFCKIRIEGKEPFWRIYWEDKNKTYFFCSEECRAKWLLSKQRHITILDHIKGEKEADQSVVRDGKLVMPSQRASGDRDDRM